MSRCLASTAFCWLFFGAAFGASPALDPALDRAARLAASGDKTEAIPLFLAYRQAHPQDLLTLTLLGDAQFAALDMHAAAGTLRTALSVDPLCDPCRAQLAESLLLTGDMAGAAETYANAPRFEPFARVYASVRRETELAASIRSSYARLGLCAIAVISGWAAVIAAVTCMIGKWARAKDQRRGINRASRPRA